MSFEDQQDAISDSSTESQATEQQPSEPSEVSAAPEASAQPAEESVPFHKHPRFQELISRNNEYKTQLEEQRKALDELRSQMAKASQPPPQKDELMERLKGIDPAFAERFGKISEVDALKQQLAEFNEWRAEQQRQASRQEATSTIDKFYADNKVPEDRRDVYNAMLQAQVASNPNLKVTDLPNVLKAVHDRVSKLFTTVERQTTKNFVDGKKAEAAKPTSLPKGAPAAAKKQEQPLSRQELLAEMKKAALDDARNGKDI